MKPFALIHGTSSLLICSTYNKSCVNATTADNDNKSSTNNNISYTPSEEL